MSLSLAVAHPAVAASPDEAALKTIVESVASLADRGDFESLGKLFADEVRVDYASLSGEAPTLTSPQALMSVWSALLPGFDRTRHALSRLKAVADGETGSATADVAADHWIGGRRWTVAGSYAYAFARDDDAWRITSMQFNLKREEGARDLLDKAGAAAAARPASYVVRQKTRQAVLDFLTGLEEKNMAKVGAVWAEDAVQEMPYVPKGFPTRVVGREALIRHYADWPKISGAANFTRDLVFHAMTDPEQVFVEYRGVVEITTTGRVYGQRYGGLFHVEDGKIALFREYFDPRAFARAFGMND